jgi:hypothetical protein
MDCLSLVVIACVVNQFNNHWLLFDALQSTITMCLKFKEEIANPSTLVSLIDDGSRIALELSLFVSNIKKKSLWCFGFFYFFKEKLGKKKVHNMLSLMLDLRFKSFHLV